MATTIRSSNSNSATTGTAITVDAPTGTTVGDLVVISVHGNAQTTIVDNNGSTAFTEDLNDYQPNPTGGHTVSIFSRRIVLGDPSTYAFTLGTTGRWSIVAITFKNPHPNTIYSVSPSSTNAANSDDSAAATKDAPSINTLNLNDIHVVCGYSDDGTGGAGSIANRTTIQAPVNQPQVVAYKVISSPVATGAITYTATTSAPRIALSFVVRDIGHQWFHNIKGSFSSGDGLSVSGEAL